MKSNEGMTYKIIPFISTLKYDSWHKIHDNYCQCQNYHVGRKKWTYNEEIAWIGTFYWKVTSGFHNKAITVFHEMNKKKTSNGIFILYLVILLKKYKILFDADINVWYTSYV